MSVAALVASQDDRDCPAPAPSSKVEIAKKSPHSFQPSFELRTPVEAFSSFALSLSLLLVVSLFFWNGVIIQKLTAVTEVENRDLLLEGCI
jgi:hypothetical protein